MCVFKCLCGFEKVCVCLCNWMCVCVCVCVYMKANCVSKSPAAADGKSIIPSLFKRTPATAPFSHHLRHTHTCTCARTHTHTHTHRCRGTRTHTYASTQT